MTASGHFYASSLPRSNIFVMKACLVAVCVVALFTACAAEDDPTVSLPGVTDLSAPRLLSSMATFPAPVCPIRCFHCFHVPEALCRVACVSPANLRRSSMLLRLTRSRSMIAFPCSPGEFRWARQRTKTCSSRVLCPMVWTLQTHDSGVQDGDVPPSLFLRSPFHFVQIFWHVPEIMSVRPM